MHSPLNKLTETETMKLHKDVTSKISKRSFATLEDRFNTIHENKYTYEKSIYLNMGTHIVITCPLHGDFTQPPRRHLKGIKCQRCAANRSTTEEFIVKANTIHNGRYDYSAVKYLDNHTAVQLLCKTHGAFYQQPNNHLQGKGCKKCGAHSGGGSVKLFTNVPTILYVLEFEGSIFKIGVTTLSVAERYKKEKCSYTVLHTALFTLGQEAWNLEQQVIKTLKEYKYTGRSPLRFTETSEMFTVNPIETLMKGIKC